MADFQPADANFAERVANSFARQSFMTLIDARLAAVSPGYVEIELPVWQDITQQHGFVHGGAVGAIADSAAGYAARSLMDDRSAVLTVEYKINFLAPSGGEVLIARGRVIKPGRQLFVCSAEVAAASKGAEKTVAIAQYTMARVENRPDISGTLGSGVIRGAAPDE